jgi:predicted nucleic acid-binding protein
LYVIDASVWVSRFIQDDVFYGPTREWFSQIRREAAGMAGPALLLAEFAGATARRTGDRGLARTALALLLTMPRLQLVSVDARLARLSSELAADLGLRGADAVYVALAHTLDVPLVTWDQEQIESGAVLATVHRPSDLTSG